MKCINVIWVTKYDHDYYVCLKNFHVSYTKDILMDCSISRQFLGILILKYRLQKRHMEKLVVWSNNLLGFTFDSIKLKANEMSYILTLALTRHRHFEQTNWFRKLYIYTSFNRLLQDIKMKVYWKIHLALYCWNGQLYVFVILFYFIFLRVKQIEHSVDKGL